MKAAEIALRQEIRQMLSEAGITKESLREMAHDVLEKEIAKQVKNVTCQTNVNAIVYNASRTYEIKDIIKQAIQKEIANNLDITVQIDAAVGTKEKKE